MPVYDTPITTDDNSLPHVLKAGLPVVLYLHDHANATNDDALNRIAKEHVGKLLVTRVNTSANPQTYAQYGRPTLPAVVTLENGSVKSQAGAVQPASLTEHARYLLGQAPKPQEVPQPKTTAAGTGQPFNVTDASFKTDVLQSDTPVLVDFWAPWCGPCHRVAPSLEQIAQEYNGQVKVAKLNVDDNPQMARQYQANSIPLLVLFKNGKIVNKLVGAHPKPNIEQLVKQAL